MKRWISALLCLVLILAMTGCGNNSSAGKPESIQPAGVNDVLKQGVAEADGEINGDSDQPSESVSANDRPSTNEDTQSPESSTVPDVTEGEPSADIDVDLTVLSGTMVYSEVYNMMASPEMYIGKTVKMKGPFAYYHDEATGKYYFACIIQDAAACCAQGIEFILTDDYIYPDDYPELDEEICVVGVFDTYQEGDCTYCTLRNAALV